jgi:hypothetical protein
VNPSFLLSICEKYHIISVARAYIRSIIKLHVLIGLFYKATFAKLI